ncbi:MAG: riboflavin synthase [Alphaproteobacteria bacterium]|jgi:riboflavin synthase|nr:riboflavin synthase [Alphaproteobacteria bacterium]
MFTGLVSDIGRITAIEQRGDVRMTIETAFDMDAVALGASIACSGACLTVVDKGEGWFAIDASAETLSKTTLGDWREGREINLERSLTIGDEIGGHLVSGHVDGTIELLSRTSSGDSLVLVFAMPDWLAPYVAPKGSIALDGISLTVNGVADDRFDINIIPHTQQMTTFGALEAGERVNVEIDMLARYARRALAHAGVAA